MPFYEYECSACKHHTEVLQKISDAPLKKCPNCGKQALKRLISAPVFRLKGGGWYETDFKSDGETKRNLVGKEEGESKSEDKKAEASTDSSKPEAKSETAPKAESTPSVKSGGGDAKAKPAKAAKPKPKAKPAAKKRR
jgi:putative FmdB family regulatory protein